MTTSDPRADRGDDAPEHRTIGQRIRDAVLGDPVDDRHDAPADSGRDAGHADDWDHVSRGEVHGGEVRGGEVRGSEVGPADRDRIAGSSAGTTPADAGRDLDRGDLDRGDLQRGNAGHGGTLRDDRDDDPRAGGHEYAPYEQAMREHVEGGAVPDPVRDDVDQDGNRRTVVDRTVDRSGDGYGDEIRTAGAGGAAGGRQTRDFTTSSYDPDRDTGYDPQAAGTAVSGAGAAGGRETPDLVTSSYDPDRDAGYDPHAAGTAMTGTPAVQPAGATAVQGQDLHDRATSARGSRGYDPAADTGYVDEDRAGTDRTTGHRDADYDTGRVDTDRDTDRDDRDDSGGGSTAGATAATGGTVAAGGAAAAAGVTARSRDRAADDRAEAVADESAEDSGRRERLVPADRAQAYISRYDALKGDFVDEPRRAVAQADDLVGELLDEIQRLFADQRRDLEQGFDHDRASTEDLRLALRRYRSFFDRLLSF